MRRDVLLFILCTLIAGSAGALTYVPMSDAALIDSAPLIVEAEVVDAAPAAQASLPSTDYQVEVREVLKGSVPGSTLVVRVAGARLPGGLGLELPGVVELIPGERALLLLRPHGDGTFRLVQLTLGAFHRVRAGGRELALRWLGDALELSRDGVRRGSDSLRDYESFKSYVRARGAGRQPKAGYRLAADAVSAQSLSDAFTLFSTGGLNLRWREFDSGQSVTFFAHEDGQPGVVGGGFADFRKGLEAWTDDPATPISLVYGGTTAATGGLSTFDGINAIVFDDPNGNATFGGTFSCISGGVLALGGPWFDPDLTHLHNGVEYIDIVGADMVTNKGAGCFLAGPKVTEEVFAHELGHTLGLRHSCGDRAAGPCDTSGKDEALMRAFVHADGRGALLGADDRAGIDFLYGGLTPAACEASETALCLAGDRFRVEVSWRTRTGASGEGQAVELTPNTGYFTFFNAANVEMVLKVLDGCATNGHFWVFAGGLTNVEVEITVTDTATGEVRTYSNALGTPFAPLQDTAAFDTCS